MSEAVVVFDERALKNGQKLGVARLNLPKALNALSLEMVELLLAQFQNWAEDSNIAAVWLEGTGDKAFCAGGDIVALYTSMTEQNNYAETFFVQEYKLDYLIHTYPKPLVVWGNGIVMGGGIGLFAGAGFRVVTENSRLAMPEISIGLYPDVGASWFLNRMPGRCGLFLGLTGAHFNAADAKFIGLGDRFIPHALRAEVIDSLCQADWSKDSRATVGQVLREFEAANLEQQPAGNIEPNLALIQELTDADSDLARAQKMLAYTSEDPWIARALASLKAGSPSSMLLIQRQLRLSRHASLREVFQQELNLSVQSSLKGEFAEGVRALLIDKDRNPRWNYAAAEEVEEQWLAAFFEPLWPQNPLHNL